MLGNEEIASLAGNPDIFWWHALYTRHQHENVVAQALSGKGFAVFLPQYRTVHRWKDRQKALLLPLFPNYVFIRGGLDRMLSIVTTPGVVADMHCHAGQGRTHMFKALYRIAVQGWRIEDAKAEAKENGSNDEQLDFVEEFGTKILSADDPLKLDPALRSRINALRADNGIAPLGA